MANIFGFFNESNPEPIIQSIEKNFPNCIENKRVHHSQITISQISNPQYIIPPIITDNIVCYFYGEIYNYLELNRKFNLSAATAQEALIESYTKNILSDYLNQTNGKFHCCIYDKKLQKIYLIVDRFGLHHFYWYHKNDDFAFANYVNTFFYLPNIDLEKDLFSAINFYSNGQLLGNHSWFKYIKLMNPASILEFDCKNKKITQKFYWTFKEVKQQKIPYSEAVNRLSETFLRAMNSRIKLFKDKRIGLPLSGGRDSRMFIAFMNNCCNVKYIYTVGKKDSGDVCLAKQICKQFNLPHHHFEATEKINILSERTSYFLDKLNGAISIQYLHQPKLIKELRQYADVMISGYPAGEIFWDNLLLFQNNLNKKSIIQIPKSADFEELKQTNEIYHTFLDCPHPDLFYLFYRIRRFGGENLFSIEKDFKVIIPYFDNEIIELIFGLPDEYRLKGLYSDALTKAFPKFYKNIPWQRTGLPSRFYEIPSCYLSKRDKIQHWFRFHIAKPIYLLLYGKKYQQIKQEYFIDYAELIRNTQNSHKFIELLNPATAYFSKLFTTDLRQTLLLPHLKKEADYHISILNSISAELYQKHIDNIVKKHKIN